jgi:hypothetical protein
MLFEELAKLLASGRALPAAIFLSGLVYCLGCGDRKADLFNHHFSTPSPASVKECNIEQIGKGEIKADFVITESDVIALCKQGNLEIVPDDEAAGVLKEAFLDAQYKTTKAASWPQIHVSTNVMFFFDRRREKEGIIRYLVYVNSKAYYCRMNFGSHSLF